MIIKLSLEGAKLEALNKVLETPDNVWRDDRSCGHFVWIKESRSAAIRPEGAATPDYEVTLEALHRYPGGLRGAHLPTPLSKLVRVFQAIGLYPDDKPAV